MERSNLSKTFRSADLLDDSPAPGRVWQTGVNMMDVIMAGGFGLGFDGKVTEGELVILAGVPGSGKSAMLCNWIKPVVDSGHTPCLISLENSERKTRRDLVEIVGDDKLDKILFQGREEIGKKRFKLDDMVRHISQIYEELEVDVIFLDHLQALFNTADTERDIWDAQKRFIKSVGDIVDELNKTMIVACHTTKLGASLSPSELQGSKGIWETATMVLMMAGEYEYLRAKTTSSKDIIARDDIVKVALRKNRNFKEEHQVIDIRRVGAKFENAADADLAMLSSDLGGGW